MTQNNEPTEYEKISSKICWDPKEFPELFGWEFRELRTKLGYVAREIAEYFQMQNIPLTTARSIYRIEEGEIVKPRYVAAFRKFVGPDIFDHTLNKLRNEPGFYRERYVFEILHDEGSRRHYAERLEKRLKEWCDRYGVGA